MDQSKNLKEMKPSQGYYDATKLIFSGKIKAEVIEASEKQEFKIRRRSGAIIIFLRMDKLNTENCSS